MAYFSTDLEHLAHINRAEEQEYNHFAGPILEFVAQVHYEGQNNDFDFLTTEIKRGFLDYVRQGIMLDKIRRLRLYKDKFKTFKSYCEQALGRQYFYCKQIIKAAGICLRLIKVGFEILPNCVAQAIPLLKHSAVDENGDSPLSSKWQEVVESVPKERISAVSIAETIDGNPEGRAKQVKVSGKAYQLLVQKAVDAGMSTSKYLEMLISGIEPPDEEPPDDENEKVTTDSTAEQCEILDQVDARIKDASAIGKTSNPAGGFTIRPTKKPSRSPQKAINRSDTLSDSS